MAEELFLRLLQNALRSHWEQKSFWGTFAEEWQAMKKKAGRLAQAKWKVEGFVEREKEKGRVT